MPKYTANIQAWNPAFLLLVTFECMKRWAFRGTFLSTGTEV